MCVMMRAPGSFAAALAVFSLASAARANGRLPGANQLFVDPSNPAHLVTRATFGMLQSADAGAHWFWICEEVISPAEALLDPATVVTGDGTMIVSTSDGPAISGGGGCDWGTLPVPLMGRDVIDFTIDKQVPAHVWTAFTDFTDAGGRTVFAESLDQGRNWQTKGQVPSFYATTLDVSPSSSLRMYAADSTGLFARSDDGGEQWNVLTNPGAKTAPVYVTAIDPKNPDRVYVRVSEAPGKLMVSDDKGASWTTIFTDASPLLGVALSPDGSKIAIGSADSGLQLSSTSTFAFHPVNPVAPKCLTWAAAGLYVCADESTDRFTIGLSIDDGASISPLLHRSDVVPLACPASSMTGGVCPSVWCDSVREPLQAKAGCQSSSGDAGGEVGVESGSPEAAREGNEDNQGEAGSTDALRSGEATPSSSGGCACRLGRGRSGPSELGLAGLLIALIRRRRRVRAGAVLELTEAEPHFF
jgi:hypothetical protein